MKIRRSLSPQVVFLEVDGVVGKITLKALKAKVNTSGRSGWLVNNGILTQWGFSGWGQPFERISFNTQFREPPNVHVSVQGARHSIREITTEGFSLVCNAEHLLWMAFGRA